MQQVSLSLQFRKCSLFSWFCRSFRSFDGALAEKGTIREDLFVVSSQGAHLSLNIEAQNHADLHCVIRLMHARCVPELKGHFLDWIHH